MGFKVSCGIHDLVNTLCHFIFKMYSYIKSAV